MCHIKEVVLTPSHLALVLDYEAGKWGQGRRGFNILMFELVGVGSAPTQSPHSNPPIPPHTHPALALVITRQARGRFPSVPGAG